jgi:hypothetical protein
VKSYNSCPSAPLRGARPGMVNRSILKFPIIIFLSLIISCKQNNEFQKIRDGNFDTVTRGRYAGNATYLPQPQEFKKLIEQFRNEIESQIDVLPLISKHFFLTDEMLSYRFKFVAHDEEKNYLIIRYFARTMNHPLYAGYQIQFVFEVHSKKLVHIYTDEVALE